MTKNRTPINRPPKTHFTPQAIEAFCKLQTLPEWSEEWWKFHNIIFDELNFKSLQWPCVRSPGPVPAEIDERKAWTDRDAEATYREIEAAVMDVRFTPESGHVQCN
jgi:hypothetical protein